MSYRLCAAAAAVGLLLAGCGGGFNLPSIGGSGSKELAGPRSCPALIGVEDIEVRDGDGKLIGDELKRRPGEPSPQSLRGLLDWREHAEAYMTVREKLTDAHRKQIAAHNKGL